MKLKITQTKSTIACLRKQIATIEALGAMMDPPLSKSGMHHRLQKLVEKEQETHGKNNRG